MKFIEAEKYFRKNIMPTIRAKENEGFGRDVGLRKQEWSFFTDKLCKDGLITQSQFEKWGYPTICQARKE